MFLVQQRAANITFSINNVRQYTSFPVDIIEEFTQKVLEMVPALVESIEEETDCCKQVLELHAVQAQRLLLKGVVSETRGAALLCKDDHCAQILQ